MFKHYHIKFKYADALSNWEWREQECSVYGENKSEARLKCIKLYGLGTDCEYKIISVEEME